MISEMQVIKWDVTEITGEIMQQTIARNFTKAAARKQIANNKKMSSPQCK